MSSRAREFVGWVIITLGVGSLQMPALGRMAMRGVDIIQFEMMRTSGTAQSILVALGAEGVAAVRQQLVLDYGFLLVYGLTLVLACRLLAVRAGAGSKAAAFGPTFVRFAVLGALCDAIENTASFVVLAGDTAQPWPALVSGFSIVKFALLALTLVYLAVGWLATLKRTPATA